MTDVASTAELDEVLTRARRWYVAWLLTWTGVLGYVLITADPAFLTANRLVPLAVVHVALLALATYLARGLRQGRRVGACAALAGFLSFANATGCMVSMGITVPHRWPSSISFVLALHAVVAAIAAVMLFRARASQRPAAHALDRAAVRSDSHGAGSEFGTVATHAPGLGSHLLVHHVGGELLFPSLGRRRFDGLELRVDPVERASAHDLDGIRSVLQTVLERPARLLDGRGRPSGPSAAAIAAGFRTEGQLERSSKLMVVSPRPSGLWIAREYHYGSKGSGHFDEAPHAEFAQSSLQARIFAVSDFLLDWVRRAEVELKSWEEFRTALMSELDTFIELLALPPSTADLANGWNSHKQAHWRDWMSEVRQEYASGLSPEINLAVAMVDAGLLGPPGPQPSRLTKQAFRIIAVCHALVPYWRGAVDHGA